VCSDLTCGSKGTASTSSFLFSCSLDEMLRPTTFLWRPTSNRDPPQIVRCYVSVTQVTAAPGGTHTRAMGWEAALPVRLHWRARQRDVDTGEGPRRYRRYLRDGLCLCLDTTSGSEGTATTKCSSFTHWTKCCALPFGCCRVGSPSTSPTCAPLIGTRRTTGCALLLVKQNTYISIRNTTATTNSYISMLYA